MPVLVTEADTPLGQRIVLRLLAAGGEVRAYAAGEGDLGILRRAGAFVAVGDRDDEGRLEAAMADVHTVVHAQEILLSDSAAALVAGATTAATAAANAGVRRLIALSVPGADPGAADELRRSAGLAERALEWSDVPTVVLRTSLLDSPALRDALATTQLVEGVRDRPVAPVRLPDVVELVAAFDALRSHAATGHAVFAADGPEEISIGDYLRRVGIDGSSLVGRRYRGEGALPLLAEGLGGPWRTADPGVPDAWTFASVRPAEVRPEPL